jgi:hypothetical protein
LARRTKRSTQTRQRFVIPKSHKFPLGNYVIKIRRVPPSEMINVHRCSQCGHHEGGPSGGTWDVDTKTIWLDKSMPLKIQRSTFMHEFHHAYKDWELWVRQSGKAED